MWSELAVTSLGIGFPFAKVKLNLSYLEDITDCVDFCLQLAKEESVIIMPGIAVGLADWLRITFAIDLSSLELAFDRIKTFCKRHEKLNQ